jgi:hypothetical protein
VSARSSGATFTVPWPWPSLAGQLAWALAFASGVWLAQQRFPRRAAEWPWPSPPDFGVHTWLNERLIRDRDAASR